MKTIIILLDLICVLITSYILIDAVIFVNSNKSVDLKEHLLPKFTIMKVMIIALTIFNIILILNNSFNFL